MNLKPMLAADSGGVENIIFPVIVSPKLDGVRATIHEDGVLSRSLKPIPNVHVQKLFSGLPEGLDGELIVGPPTAPDAYRRTVSVVMSDDKPIAGLRFYVFDAQLAPGGFTERLSLLERVFGGLDNTATIELLRQTLVTNPAELLRMEAEAVAAGYEGLILRKPDGPYKHGRSTLKEGYLLKLKRFVDGEARVVGVTELQHNENEAVVNELGRTARSSKKAGKVGGGVLGTLVVQDVVTGVQFEIGTGFSAADRVQFWHEAERLEFYQRLAKYKHFPVGAKDKPRHPVFLGWRDPLDT